jgi:hypothetical protein
MSRKSRMQSVRKAKDKRAKKLAVGGVVLLVAVLAFEVPKIIKHGGGSSSSPPAATTTTTASTGVPAAPAASAPGTAVAAALPASSTKLPNSDRAPRRTKSELYSFSHFAGKDPFVQQVSAGSTTNTTTPSTGTGAAQAASSGTSGGSSSGNGTSGVAGYSTTAQRTLAQTGAATIQVNGRIESVRLGGSFPSSNPLFKLVSVAHGVVRIGIANGSYTSGSQTVSLPTGRSLTLVDTADGVHYKVMLVSA